MKIVPHRYEPLQSVKRPFEQLQELIEREFEPWFNVERVSGTTPLALDVVDKNGEIVVKTAVPGIKEEDINISYENGILTIQAESKTEKEEKEEDWYLHEMSYGKFSRSVRLPAEVVMDKAEAVLEDGVLTVTLPRKEVPAAQRIAVKAKKLLTGQK